MGIFQALYGLFELYSKNPRILFYKKIYGLDTVTGTFVNRNHFSGYLEMIIPLTIGLIIARIDLFSMTGLKWRERILRFSERGFAVNLILSLCVVFMSIAILLSKSRSGVFLLIFSFILFFVMTVMYYGQIVHSQIWVKRFLQVIFLIIIFASLYVGIGATMERFAMEELLMTGRPIVWSNASGIASDFPVFGSGLGTFASLYPAYEEVWRGRYSHAHNDYLEYLSELGAIGLILLLGGIFFLLYHSFRIWRERKHPEVKGLTLGGIIAVSSLLIHSIGDFNLHIPANMLLFTLVLSLIVITAFHKSQNSKSKNVRSNGSRDTRGNGAKIESLEENISEGKVRKQRLPLKLKVFLYVAILVCVGAVEILIYWNQHLYYQAEKIEDIEKKSNVLERAYRLYPLNDLISHELGKANFDLGIRNLSNDKRHSLLYFQESVRRFDQSLRLNPLSAFSHFNYAQCLLYKSYLSPYDLPNGQTLQSMALEEYKKAALLAGHNREILYEVGSVLLSQWAKLSLSDKEFVTDILKKIAGDLNVAKMKALMNTWEMNVKDYSVLEKILDEKEKTYVLLGEFFGEKSLSLEQRQRSLAQAEFLNYETAKKAYNSGEREFLYLNFNDALPHYQTSYGILERTKFYQDLTGQKLIDPLEFETLRKSVNLKLAKCYQGQAKEPKKRDAYFREYLELEDSAAALNELESYLIAEGVMKKRGADSDDLDHLAFKILLYFKQNKFRDIMRMGNLLNESFVVVPDSSKQAYVEVLQLVGDSYQRVDHIYDAAEFYQMALKVDPDNLKTLVKIRRNRERLSEDEEVQKIQRNLEKYLSPRRKSIGNPQINKGAKLRRALNLDGRKIDLCLHFKTNSGSIPALVSVYFNGRVVWEDYCKGRTISVSLDTRVGENRLEVVPINRSVELEELTYTDS